MDTEADNSSMWPSEPFRTCGSQGGLGRGRYWTQPGAARGADQKWLHLKGGRGNCAACFYGRR
jgi:hypothetical protein